MRPQTQTHNDKDSGSISEYLLSDFVDHGVTTIFVCVTTTGQDVITHINATVVVVVVRKQASKQVAARGW